MAGRAEHDLGALGATSRGVAGEIVGAVVGLRLGNHERLRKSFIGAPHEIRAQKFPRDGLRPPLEEVPLQCPFHYTHCVRTHLKINGVARAHFREREAAAQDEACPGHDESEPFGFVAAEMRPQ